jgi:hypothetical protein
MPSPQTMSPSEAINAVLTGERAVTFHTLTRFDLAPEDCPRHDWRTVACDGRFDVLECEDCGKQVVETCLERGGFP